MVSKKGVIADWGSLFLSVLIVAVLIGITLLVISVYGSVDEKSISRSSAMIDASTQTRSILMLRDSSNVSIYEYVIDAHNSNDLLSLKPILEGLFNEIYNDDFFDAYLVNIKSDSFGSRSMLINSDSAVPFGAAQSLVGVPVPDGKGSFFTVLIKRVDPSDYDIEYVETKFSNIAGSVN